MIAIWKRGQWKYCLDDTRFSVSSGIWHFTVCLPNVGAWQETAWPGFSQRSWWGTPTYSCHWQAAIPPLTSLADASGCTFFYFFVCLCFPSSSFYLSSSCTTSSSFRLLPAWWKPHLHPRPPQKKAYKWARTAQSTRQLNTGGQTLQSAASEKSQRPTQPAVEWTPTHFPG